MGITNSQSPLCCVVRRSSKKRSSMECGVKTGFYYRFIWSTPGRSQKGCLVGKTSGTSPLFADQALRYVWKYLLFDLSQSLKDSVLATEAIKAGDASEDTRCTPGHWPPFLTAKPAWIHWLSERSELVMCWMERLSNASKFVRDGYEIEGEHLKRWETFIIRPRRSRSVEAYSRRTFPWTICRLVGLSSALWKNGGSDPDAV